MPAPKYVFVNGVMKLNPEYQKEQAGQGHPSTLANPNQALPIISSTLDIAAASSAQQQVNGQDIKLSDATTSTMEIMQDGEFLAKFKATQQMDGGDLLDKLSQIFARYEIPIGLLNKLLALSEFNALHFWIDDSGSMGESSDADLNQATTYIPKPRYARTKMTRWEEAEDRLHVMMDMLAYIPVSKMVVTFFNRTDRIEFTRDGLAPEEFARQAHLKIRTAFTNPPQGGTPTYTQLSRAFSEPNCMHYLFTDGSPSDCTVEQLKQLVLRRQNPKLTPLTFISCTNNDDEAEWMKEIENDAPFTAELDDFISERREVLKDQGPGFPFSKGFWLLSQLVAAINPDDLDALDEDIPFTRGTLSNLMGYEVSQQQFEQQYFLQNPHVQKHHTYRQAISQFARMDLMAKQIVKIENGHPRLLPTPAPASTYSAPASSGAYAAAYPAQAASYSSASAAAAYPAGYPSAPAYSGYPAQTPAAPQSGWGYQPTPAAPVSQQGMWGGSQPASAQQQPAYNPQQPAYRR